MSGKSVKQSQTAEFEPARFPPDFVDSILDGAASVIAGHLAVDHQDIAWLFDMYVCLADYRAHAQANQVLPVLNANAGDWISEVTRTLAKLRYSFRSQADGAEIAPHLSWVDLHAGQGGA